VLDEREHLGAVRERGRVQRDTLAHESLEPRPSGEHDERQNGGAKRPPPRELAQREVQRVTIDQRAVEVDDERNGARRRPLAA
jgi:hypothetical protein